VRGWARPARPLAPIAVTAAILVLWFLVAHNSGAGWVQVLGDLVFGALVIGMVAPPLFLVRARVRIVSAPGDGRAGLPVSLHLAAATRLRIRPVDPPGDEALVGPMARGAAGDDRVILLPLRRGVHDTVTLDIATAAPFALQWWTRRITLPLPGTLHVAPRRGQAEALPRRPDADAGEADAQAHTDVGLPRGARPYAWGDHRRHVHWQATAHAGELMMRELERPLAETVTVSVVLPADQDEAERVAERALGTVLLLLDRGAPVTLGTLEASGPVQATVRDRRQAGRRLARAVSADATAPGSIGIAVAP
jgi:uncharacterized protein (DUF58 family)